MHEASLMNDLMRKVQSLSESRGGRRVTAVEVRLGAMRHMSPEHFTYHFEQASAGTVAEGASLNIVESDDLDDPAAQGLLLLGIEIEA